MVRELENLQKVILSLDLQLAELREKLTAANNEVHKEIDKNRRMKKSLQAIRIDIHHASTHIQNTPTLQKAVRVSIFRQSSHFGKLCKRSYIFY